MEGKEKSGEDEKVNVGVEEEVGVAEDLLFFANDEEVVEEHFVLFSRRVFPQTVFHSEGMDLEKFCN